MLEKLFELYSVNWLEKLIFLTKNLLKLVLAFVIIYFLEFIIVLQL